MEINFIACRRSFIKIFAFKIMWMGYCNNGEGVKNIGNKCPALCTTKFISTYGQIYKNSSK